MIIVTARTFEEALQKINLPDDIKAKINSYFWEKKNEEVAPTKNNFGVTANGRSNAVFIKDLDKGVLSIRVYFDDLKECSTNLYAFEIEGISGGKDDEENKKELFFLFVGDNVEYKLVVLNGVLYDSEGENYTIYDISLDFEFISGPLLITVPICVPTFRSSGGNDGISSAGKTT